MSERSSAVRPAPKLGNPAAKPTVLAAELNTADCKIEALEFGDGVLPKLIIDEVVRNIEIAHAYMAGGQGVVHLCRWRHPPHMDWASPFQAGRPLAIKHCMQRGGGSHFNSCSNQERMHRAAAMGREALAGELRALSILHMNGCGGGVVRPLATIQWPGQWIDDKQDRDKKWYFPTYGYVMPEYRLGSVASLLTDCCYRRAPEPVERTFLSMRFISNEMAQLLGELHKIHTTKGVELMIQDLTPGNLLVDDGDCGGSACCSPTPAWPSGGMRLLLSDPGMAKPISQLKRRARNERPMGTWLWGSMAAWQGRFDETADLYSLSFIGTEMWLVAEGAAMPARDAVRLLRLDHDRPQGVQFIRHLVLEVVKAHHRGGKMRPRVPRHLPVSWLGAWALLLGCRDHKTLQNMLHYGLPCLRPSEADMLCVYDEWARIAAAAEELPADLTAEQAHGPGCAGLVQDMCSLFDRLKRLSHLDSARDLEDVPTRWLAANFMEQQHLLVTAMRAQGAVGVGKPDAEIKRSAWRFHDWLGVVQAAERTVQNGAHAADLDWQRDAGPSLWCPQEPEEPEPAPVFKHKLKLPLAPTTTALLQLVSQQPAPPPAQQAVQAAAGPASGVASAPLPSPAKATATAAAAPSPSTSWLNGAPGSVFPEIVLSGGILPPNLPPDGRNIQASQPPADAKSAAAAAAAPSPGTSWLHGAPGSVLPEIVLSGGILPPNLPPDGRNIQASQPPADAKSAAAAAAAPSPGTDTCCTVHQAASSQRLS